METVKLGDSPCCSELKKKLQKSEKGRSALRQAIKVLEGTVDRLQDENNSLKRVLDDERERVRLELEVYARKSASQKELEKEICCLKEEIYALQKTNQSKCQNEDREEKLCHRIRELEGEVDMLKENLHQERRRGDLESQKAESAKKLMASEKRKADDAKKHADDAKNRADAEKKRADLERNRAEEQRCFADAAKNEVALERQKLVEERVKVEEANRRVSSEKDRADKEKKRADLQMKEAQELKQSIEVEKKRSTDEKAHGNNTQKLLEEERQRREALEKELLRASSAGRENKQCPHCNIKDTSHPLSGYKRKNSVKEKLLKEKLKLKAKQLQNIERAAKEERTQRDLRQLEVSLLKQDAVQFWNRINLLENLFSRDDDHSNDHLAKSDALGNTRALGLKKKTPIKGSCNFPIENNVDLGKRNHRMMKNSTHHGTLVEYNGTHQPVSGNSCREILSGINFQSVSPVGVPLRSKSQHSAIYSTTSSLSDRRLVGSQGKDDFSVLTSSELCKEGLDQDSIPAKVTSGKFKRSMTGQCDNPSSVDESDAVPVNQTSLVPYADVEARSLDKCSLLGNKMRSPGGDVLKLINRLHSKNLKNNLKMEKILRSLRSKETFKVEGPSLGSDQKFNLEGSKRLQACKPTQNCGSEYATGKRRKLCSAADVISGTVPPEHIEMRSLGVSIEFADTDYANISNTKSSSIKEHVYSGEGKALDITHQDMLAVPCLDDMIKGDFLKLLELDESTEERYRMALEEPLSPSLPEINFNKYVGIDESICLLEMDWLNRSPEYKEETSTPYEAFDVIHREKQLSNMKGSCDSVGLLDKKLAIQSFHSFEASKVTSQSLVPDFDRSHIVASNMRAHDVCAAPEFNSLLSTCEIDKSLRVNAFGLTASDIQSQDVELECANEHRNLTLGCLRCPVDLSDTENENNMAEPDMLNLPTKLLFNEDAEADKAYSSFPDIVHTELDRSLISNRSLQGHECQPIIDSLFNLPCSFSVVPVVHDDLACSPAAAEVDTHECERISCGDYAQEVGLDVLCSPTSLKSCMNEALKSCDKMEIQTSTYLVDDLYEANSPTTFGDTHQNPFEYLVVFPGIEDEGIILKLYHTLHASQRIHVPQKEFMIEKLILFLTNQMNLLDRERASVFFSSLLCNYVLNVQADCSSNSWMKPPFYTGSLIRELKNVVDQQNCWLEMLVILIMEFIINGRVLHFVKSHELRSDCSNIKALSLDGQEVFLSSQVASINLLVAGSTILACIFSAVGQTSFLWEVSYRVLRQCKKSSLWILTVLHCFYSVCGESFFMPSSCNQVAIVMQTIVSLLEEGDKLGNRKPSSHEVLVAYDDSKFSPCARCPFAKDVISTENVLMMLLEQIQDQSVHACMLELVTMFNDGIESHTFFSKYLGKQSECTPACSSSTLFDKFSLLELLAFYMGWDWTYNKIIPPLLELLESSIPIVSVAAILILVGHLARLGIDASGHEEKGVEQLRCNLSQFLNPINKCCFLIQLAAVTALLNILSIEFTKCIGKDAPSNVCKSNHMMIVRKWFNDLNTDQQSSSLCMLATDAVGNSG